MERTRLSLLYVTTYLAVSGVGFLLFPDLSLRLLFSNGHYETLFVRVTGLFIFALSILVSQCFRYRIKDLYLTLIWVRVFLCTSYVVFYSKTSDPLFLAFLAVVGLGLSMSVYGYYLDRKEREL
jgi:hypothetical protein